MSHPHPSDAVLDQLETAEQLKLDGRHQEAISILEGLLLDDPGLVSALEEIADNELSLERFDRAERAAKQALALNPESYTAEYILGFLKSQQEKWPDAVCHLQRANRMKANNAEIIRCLGWALFNSGKRTQGIVTLERSLNLDRNNPLTLCDLGVAYLQAKNFSKAKLLFTRTLDIDPTNCRARECAAAVDRLQRSLK